MAGSRTPGSACISKNHEGIDRGTLCRHRSPRPGPTLAAAKTARQKCEKADGMNASMELSTRGLDFIYSHEALKGVSNRLHWPGGASGVTLGPGYDMKERTAEVVESDLTGIGVNGDSAKKASEGVGKRDEHAKKFAKDHHDLINLTSEQERKLLKIVVPSYENTVRTLVRVSLNQNQYDALVSFVYNIGPANFRSSTLLHKLNQCDYKGAANEFGHWTKSGGKVLPGLVKRRSDEKSLFESPPTGDWERALPQTLAWA